MVWYCRVWSEPFSALCCKQQRCMCMLIYSSGATHRQASLTDPIPALATTLPTAPALRNRGLCAQQASLILSRLAGRSSTRSIGSRCSARSQSVGVLPSSQLQYSSCRTSSCAANSRLKFTLSGICNASALIGAQIAEECKAQQRQAACLAGLVSTVAALLLIPGPIYASEPCQAIANQANHHATQSRAESNCTADVTDLPGSFAEQSDPVNPFTLFGNTRKKFLIENMEGSKVVSRKKGFTTKTCVSGVPTQQQTPKFESLPLSAKAEQADTQLCSKTTGSDLKETCAASCSQACTAALKDYTDKDSKFTGYSIDAKAKDKLSKSCVRQCIYECAKPGSQYGFAIPFR